MIHWIHDDYETESLEAFLAREHPNIEDAEGLVSCHAVYGCAFVWVDPYQDELHGKRVICYARSNLSAASCEACARADAIEDHDNQAREI